MVATAPSFDRHRHDRLSLRIRLPLAAVLCACLLVAGWTRVSAEESFNDLRVRAESGDVRAQADLGRCYALGIGVAKDVDEAVKWYRKAAARGNALAQNGLGTCYATGTGGVEQDPSEAVKWYRKAAEQGFSKAQNNLGRCYLLGEGVPKNPTLASEWFSRAAKGFRKDAERGDAAAQYNLGVFYAIGEGGMEKNSAEAAKWYHKAAEQGHAEAQFRFGVCCARGEGISADSAEAAKWLLKAAEQGNAEAQFCIGTCFNDGMGVARNPSEAVRWFRKAADQGHEAAQAELARTESRAPVPPRDRDASRDALPSGNDRAEIGTPASSQIEAPQGVLSTKLGASEFDLGTFYANEGRLDDAVRWFRKAADHGHEGAQHSLRTLLEQQERERKDEALKQGLEQQRLAQEQQRRSEEQRRREQQQQQEYQRAESERLEREQRLAAATQVVPRDAETTRLTPAPSLPTPADDPAGWNTGYVGGWTAGSRDRKSGRSEAAPAELDNLTIRSLRELERSVDMEARKQSQAWRDENGDWQQMKAKYPRYESSWQDGFRAGYHDGWVNPDKFDDSKFKKIIPPTSSAAEHRTSNDQSGNVILVVVAILIIIAALVIIVSTFAKKQTSVKRPSSTSTIKAEVAATTSPADRRVLHCPQCGSGNPPGTLVCNCGYGFDPHTVPSQITDVPKPIPMGPTGDAIEAGKLIPGSAPRCVNRINAQRDDAVRAEHEMDTQSDVAGCQTENGEVGRLIHFFLYAQGEQKGPYTIGQLRAMWSSGSITSDTQYCEEGGSEWKAMSLLEPKLTAATRTDCLSPLGTVGAAGGETHWGKFYSELGQAFILSVGNLLAPFDSIRASDGQHAPSLEEFFKTFLVHANEFTEQCCHNFASGIRQHSIVQDVRGTPTNSLARQMRAEVFEKLDGVLKSYIGDLANLNLDLQQTFVDLSNTNTFNAAMSGAAVGRLVGGFGSGGNIGAAAGGLLGLAGEKVQQAHLIIQQANLIEQARQSAVAHIVEYLRGVQELPRTFIDYTGAKCCGSQIDFALEDETVAAIEPIIRQKLGACVSAVMSAEQARLTLIRTAQAKAVSDQEQSEQKKWGCASSGCGTLILLVSLIALFSPSSTAGEGTIIGIGIGAVALVVGLSMFFREGA